jgi:tRNA A37 N6-isopentenylltransferase MiaA
MKTTEQIFLETKAIFAAQAAEAMADAMDTIYTQYLPHVESDTQSNQYFQISRWLESFFADSLREDDIKVDLTRLGWCAEQARQKIYEANKQEITEAIGKDWQAEIQSLKEQLNAAYRRY